MSPVASAGVHEVRRDDGELCGYVAERAGRWASMTVFGGRLGEHGSSEDAERHVRNDGLASLADRWTLVDRVSGDEQIACIQEASPAGVTLALDHYSMPGVPVLRLSREDLTGGRWQLRRD